MRYKSPGRGLTLSFVLAACVTSPAAETCKFQRRATAVGDIAKQTIQCDLELTVSMSQHDQVIDSSQQKIERELSRSMKILAAGDFAPSKALVTYDKAALTVKQAKSDAKETHQPVSGKSYIVMRTGGQLTITDSNGKTPPPNEMEVLRTNLETFGRPNPIAEFFGGRSFQVGQTISLPTEFARELLGIPDAIGNVSKLTMKLTSVRDIDSHRAAEFQVELKAETPQPQGMQMTLNGQLFLEIDTCRALAVSLAGPVSVEEIHGPADGKFSVESNGDLRVAVQASYGPSKR